MPFTSKTAKAAGAKSSRKGVPNKTTDEVREAFKNLIASKIPDLDRWLEEVAKKNPERALEIIVKFSDFIVPKLQRIDTTNQHIVEDLGSLSLPEINARIAELKKKLFEDD
ncbi:hypothetical protein [Robertkochia flava]|uniref:hypothetical protein n=1 Tax=Robertkochia flava TaxID=3447986 RepID=UPI001CCC327A|nr:hypothetical protein [Robertkochia marina]